MLIFPNNGDDLPSTLREVITEGADSPMTTVGIIGRGNLTSLANSLADEALFEGREEGIYNKHPVEIHASYQRSTATLYLVIVSVYDGQGLDFLSRGAVHSGMLDYSELLETTSFLLLTTCTTVYLADHAPRMDFHHLRLLRRLCDLRRSSEEQLRNTADVVHNNTVRGTHGMLHSRYYPGNVTPTMYVLLPHPRDVADDNYARSNGPAKSRYSTQLIIGLRTTLGAMTDLFSLDVANPLFLLNDVEMEVVLGNRVTIMSLAMGKFSGCGGEGGGQSKEQRIVRTLSHAKELLNKSLLLLHSESAGYYSNRHRRRDAALSDVLPSVNGWVQGFSFLSMMLVTEEVKSSLSKMNVWARFGELTLRSTHPPAIAVPPPSKPSGNGTVWSSNATEGRKRAP